MFSTVIEDLAVRRTLRSAFEEAIEAFVRWSAGSPEPRITVDGRELTIGQVAGLLWNCTDIAPEWILAELNHERGGTYADAARRLKEFYTVRVS